MLDPGAMGKTFVESLSGFPGMERVPARLSEQWARQPAKWAEATFLQCQGHGECCTTYWTTLAQQLDKWIMLHAVDQSRSVCFCYPLLFHLFLPWAKVFTVKVWVFFLAYFVHLGSLEALGLWKCNRI